MSRYSAITCDVCGKKAAERISDWFEIDAGPDGFFAVHLNDRPSGMGRASRDICGSRCLCVALERWSNGYLKQLKETSAGPEEEPQEWIVPRTSTAPPLMIESPHLVPSKIPKADPVAEALPEEKLRRRGGIVRRSLTR